ncbi:hypothetical protein [Thermus sp.]|uniref:hypothetical protein n=1 Tax=Thermus sp. TaxID=275 RepID=UPI0025F57853|nr:hypothetical protein [Thermus sp.]MCS6867288.1 hypothetical protein [Thermus sp.]
MEPEALSTRTLAREFGRFHIWVRGSPGPTGTTSLPRDARERRRLTPKALGPLRRALRRWAPENPAAPLAGGTRRVFGEGPGTGEGVFSRPPFP